MKYKRIPQSELDKLEGEFVKFLAANTITAEDWEKLKLESPERADELIDLFSDIVYENVLSKIEYLEFRDKSEIKLFHCNDDQIELMGLELQADETPDLRSENGLKEALKEAEKFKVRLFSGAKEYIPNRPEEVFRMMEAGTKVCGPELYDWMKELQEKSQEIKGE